MACVRVLNNSHMQITDNVQICGFDDANVATYADAHESVHYGCKGLQLRICHCWNYVGG